MGPTERNVVFLLRLLLLVLAAAAAPTRARADHGDRPRDAARCVKAQQQATQGDEYLAEGVFDPAIASYVAAFERCADKKFRAAMVFNLGLAYKRRAEATTAAALAASTGADASDDGDATGEAALTARRAAVEDRRKALEQFRDFLGWTAEGRLSDEARSYVFRLQSDIDAEEAAITAETARLADARLARHQQAERARRARTRRGRLQVTSAVVAGVGVGLLAAGTYQGWRAHTLSRELSNIDDWTPDAMADVDAGERAERWMIGLTVSGGVALAAACTLFWYARRDHGADESLALTPVITTRGIAMAGSF